ncbi:MAG: hypothetical protein LBT21_01965 [Oscillospiraceae bacterium]|jgi:hypothetical protein|nr:hypothetical protein [Oscillospiraceae bacterium]
MKKQISGALYLIPVLLLIAAIALPTFFGVSAAEAFKAPRQEAFLNDDGKARFDFTELGAYELFQINDYTVTESATISFENKNSGDIVTLAADSNVNATISINNRTYRLVAEFNISENPGEYFLTVTSANNKPMSGQFLVVPQDTFAKAVIYILAAIFGGVFPFIGAVIGFVVIAIIRAARKRRQAPDGYAPPSQYAPYQPIQPNGAVSPPPPQAPQDIYKRYSPPPKQ